MGYNFKNILDCRTIQLNLMKLIVGSKRLGTLTIVTVEPMPKREALGGTTASLWMGRQRTMNLTVRCASDGWKPGVPPDEIRCFQNRDQPAILLRDHVVPNWLVNIPPKKNAVALQGAQWHLSNRTLQSST